MTRKDFPKLYSDHEATWKEIVKNAVEFLDKGLAKPEQIHADDLSEAIRSMIEVHPDFVKFLQEQSLTQQYWTNYFSDYIVDQIYSGIVVTRKNK